MSDHELHRIDAYLGEDWIAELAGQVVRDVEAYLGKHAAFHAFLGDDD